MKLSKKKVLKRLITYIENEYDNDYTLLYRDLQNAIYCLHFLAEDDVPRNEVQDLCFVLHKLGECFYDAHSLRKRLKKRAEAKKFEQSKKSSEWIEK